MVSPQSPSARAEPQPRGKSWLWWHTGHMQRLAGAGRDAGTHSWYLQCHHSPHPGSTSHHWVPGWSVERENKRVSRGEAGRDTRREHRHRTKGKMETGEKGKDWQRQQQCQSQPCPLEETLPSHCRGQSIISPLHSCLWSPTRLLEEAHTSHSRGALPGQDTGVDVPVPGKAGAWWIPGPALEMLPAEPSPNWPCLRHHPQLGMAGAHTHQLCAGAAV